MRVGLLPGWLVPAAIAGPSEAALLGASCTHYLLNPPHTRYSADVVAVRSLLARVAEETSEEGAPLGSGFVLRPVLVASLKGCFGDVEAPSVRMRVAFDVDGGPGAVMPPPDALHEVFCEWLDQALGSHYRWREEPCVIFGGSFADKPASCHVYFPHQAWDAYARNRYNSPNNATHVAQLNKALSVWGDLTLDVSITQSGLKYPFCDKFIKGSWRGEGQSLLAIYNLEVRDYAWLYAHCDPLVVEGDYAWTHLCNFVETERAPKRVAPPVRTAPRVQAVQQRLDLPSDPILARLIDLVPEWGNCLVKRRAACQGAIELLIPQTTWCPLKQGHHSTAGACYVSRTALDGLFIKCHKTECAQGSIRLASEAFASEREAEIIRTYNEQYVILGGNYVMVTPVVLSNGSYSPRRILTRADFEKETFRHTDIYIKKNSDGIVIAKMSFAKFWFGHPCARRCVLGEICDPSMTADPRYYNTYQGVDRRVALAAVTLEDQTDEQLLARVPMWYRCVRGNICAEDPDLLNYFLNMAAHCIQLPHVKPGVACILTGNPGCGKGLTLRGLVNIYGMPHGLQINGADLRGQYNALYSNAVILYVDEQTKAKDLQHDAQLKQMITEVNMVINEKYEPSRLAPQFQHFWFATNNEDPVHWQPGERRYMAFDCKYRVAEPASAEHIQLGADLAAEIANFECLAALYLFLHRRDISQFVPSVFPVTLAGWRTQHASLSPPEMFFYRLLATGNVCVRAWEPEQSDKERTQILISTAVQQGMLGCDVSELGFNVFDEERERMHFPSAIMFAGFKQMFPHDTRTTDGSLWKVCYQFAEQKAWDKKQHHAAPYGRIQAFRFPKQADLQAAFLRVRGNLDPRIFGDWKLE